MYGFLDGMDNRWKRISGDLARGIRIRTVFSIMLALDSAKNGKTANRTKSGARLKIYKSPAWNFIIIPQDEIDKFNLTHVVSVVA